MNNTVITNFFCPLKDKKLAFWYDLQSIVIKNFTLSESIELNQLQILYSLYDCVKAPKKYGQLLTQYEYEATDYTEIMQMLRSKVPINAHRSHLPSGWNVEDDPYIQTPSEAKIKLISEVVYGRNSLQSATVKNGLGLKEALFAIKTFTKNSKVLKTHNRRFLNKKKVTPDIIEVMRKYWEGNRHKIYSLDDVQQHVATTAEPGIILHAPS